jgi:molybdopterin molybdotransferase
MQDSFSSKLTSVEEARAIVLDQMRLMPAERVSLIESYRRVLAQDVISDIDISPFDNSAMDGFAVRFEDFEPLCSTSSTSSPSPTPNTLTSPLTLDIVGVIGAGAVFEETLQSGQALRIMTGAPMPQGADTVVKLEDTAVSGESATCPEGRQVSFTIMPKRGEHVRSKGEEARKGEVLLRAGEKVSPPGVGLLAATGNAEVLVYSRPRVAIISTGNELVGVTELPGPGQIRNSNDYSIAAAVFEAGGIPTIMPSVQDSREALVSALEAAVDEHDFVITIGGASQGDYDFVVPVVRELGELFFDKVNMKPGKAQIFGIVKDRPVFGLPGNPAAAVVGFEVLVRPALRKMQGMTALNRPLTRATLTRPAKKRDEKRRLYLRAHLEIDENGCYRVTPESNQSSALLGALNRSNCLMIVPEGLRSLSADDSVDCLRIDREEGVI